MRRTSTLAGLVALSEINGRGWTSIAELQVLGANGLVSREGWEVVMTDSTETRARYEGGEESRLAPGTHPETYLRKMVSNRSKKSGNVFAVQPGSLMVMGIPPKHTRAKHIAMR